MSDSNFGPLGTSGEVKPAEVVRPAEQKISTQPAGIPTRILFIIDKLEPAGTQMDLLQLVRKLDRSRFKPYLIAFQSDGKFVTRLIEAGVRPVMIPVKRAYGISGFRALGFLIRFIRCEKIDIVQTHFLKADMLGITAAKFAGVKKIITARRDEGFWLSKRQRMLSRFFARFSNIILANSGAVKRAAEDHEKVTRPIFVIRNGVETTKFYESAELRRIARAEFGIADTEVVVGIIANMRHAVKGYPDLIAAGEKVIDQMKNVRFLFVGDGPRRADYEALSRKHAIYERIIFAGSRQDTVRLINAMDIACLVSLSEGFSNSLLEYMACAKPVVATNVGGNPEAMSDETKNCDTETRRHGESAILSGNNSFGRRDAVSPTRPFIIYNTGILVPPQNSAALAEAILYLVSNEALRNEMGQKARERMIQKFSIDRMVKEYETFYGQL